VKSTKTEKLKKMKKTISVALVMLLSISVLNAQKWTPTYSNVDYVGKGNTKQMLDIYIPSGITTPTATIIHIHGGAFLMGSKGVSEQPSFQTFFNNGYICADINYRLSSDTLWPAQVHDCKAAIRFLKTHALQYNIDTCKIGVIGESAGGYLVAMLGTTGDVASLEGLHLGNTNATSRVQAVVDLFGPINFLTMDAEALALGFVINTNSASSPESKLMGAPVQTIPELVTQANPTTYISADDARFFISAGSADQNIPYTQGQNFNNALSPVLGSTSTSFELMAGAGHGGSFWHTTAQDAKYLEFYNTSLANGCSLTSTKPLSSTQTQVVVYPNPASNNLFIVLPNNIEYNILVINAIGQVVYQKEKAAMQVNIPVNRLPRGVYSVKAISSDRLLSTKFVKQ
jgi:acetyl esterase/lipase